MTASACSDAEAPGPGAQETVYNIAFATAQPDSDTGVDLGTGDLGDETGADAGDDAPSPTTLDGEACDFDSECFSGSCHTGEDGFPAGLCSPDPCGPETACNGPDAICYLPTSGSAFCTRTCDGSTDCRTGYLCEFISQLGFGACAPEPPAEDLPDGAPCIDDQECEGGTCLLSPEWPGGYCTTLGCEEASDCADATGTVDNRCLPNQTGGSNFCVRSCASVLDCRSRYVCQPLGDVDYCAPDPNRPLDIDADASPLNFTCDVDTVGFSTKRLAYTIDEDTTSYMVVPVALDGRRLLPNQALLPQGGAIDFNSFNNGGQLATASFLGFTGPVIMPWLNTLTFQLQAGNHDFDVDTSSQSLCAYVLQESESGSVIDLNLYLVGLPGVTADIAATDLNVTAMLDEIDAILEQAEVSIDQVRFFDADEDTTDRFRIIRSDADIYDLVAASREPGDTLDEHLSLNLFLTQGFQMGGAIGVSAGLPGPAGLHRTTGSGVVLTASALGDGNGGNEYTAQIAAHEMGHYLGLWHTTELSGNGFDPVSDTPECREAQLSDCPDLDNLMFPIAGSSHVDLSDGQVWMLLSNPLTKAPAE